MKKYLGILLILLTAVSCSKGELFETNQYSLETSTKMAGDIVKGTPNYFGHIKQDKETHLAPGVSLLEMSYLNMKGYAVQLYLYKVALGSASLGVAVPANSKTSDYTSVLAGNLNAETTVLGAVNGDTQAADKRPSGIVYRNGTAVKTTFSDNKGGFFSVLKDGTAIIADPSDYATYRTSLYNAIGTRTRILRDGYPVTETTPKEEARTFVAVSQDGMTVWLGVVDGVYFYYSNGITLTDLASVLKAAGAWNASVLASGNVTTMVRRNDSCEQLFPVVNKPSSKGIEQESVNALAIIEN